MVIDDIFKTHKCIQYELWKRFGGFFFLFTKNNDSGPNHFPDLEMRVGRQASFLRIIQTRRPARKHYTYLVDSSFDPAFTQRFIKLSSSSDVTGKKTTII